MTQTTMQFDAVKAEKAKRRGMDFAAQHKGSLLAKARGFAMDLALIDGQVNADDIQDYLLKLGFSSASLGNAAGSIFRGPEWECVGWQKSERVSNHGRMIRVWRLRQ